MKIYGAGTTGPISGADSLASRLGKNRAQGGGATTRTDVAGSEVRVSKEAMRLSLQAPAGFDLARVERLRDAHESGSLAVDPSVIARRLQEEN